MPIPPAVDAFFKDNLTLLLALLCTISLLLVILVLVLTIRLGRLSRVYRKLTQGTSGGNLEEHLVGYSDQVRDVGERMKDLEARTTSLADSQRRCLQRVGMVRYDAFEDVGGEQSFSLALTDADRNGAVISSVYSRSDVRVYAKALANGRSSHPLSVEDQRALAEAEASTERTPSRTPAPTERTSISGKRER